MINLCSQVSAYVPQVFDAVLAYATALQRLYEVDLINEVSGKNEQNLTYCGRNLEGVSLTFLVFPFSTSQAVRFYENFWSMNCEK
jgi:hypothetical protein